MGLQRTPLSLHPTIFEKGSLTLCSKMFSNLSTKLFMVFIFRLAEKGVFFQKTGFWRTLLSIFMNCFSLHFWKRVVDTIHQNVFQLINQIYLWVFIFRLAEKGYNTMQLYIYSLIRTRNPDLRSSSFGPRPSFLTDSVLHIWRGSVSRNEWGIEVLPYRGFSASCDFWKGVYETMFQNVFQLVNQNIYGFLFWGLQRTPLSLHLVIFEKMSLTLLTKRFSNLSTKIFMGFY
jgi:hypothetical protein